MEGVYSFFLESSFIGLFLYGEKILGPVGHWFAAALVCAGSWLSGFFIVATDAWMQHPTGYAIGPGGGIVLNSFWGLLSNPWAQWQYLHTMMGATTTGAFVVAAVGAFYLISNRHVEHAKIFVSTGILTALFAALFLLATGDGQGRNIAMYQPVTLAATEGLFETSTGAPLAILGQPNTATGRLDNPLLLPRVLSFLTYRHWAAEVKGLRAYPRDLWPDNIPLLYYSFHIMVGLGTIFVAITLICAIWLWRGKLFQSKPLLWLLMLALPFPYIANTAGWMTAELGRQPWLIYGMMRTDSGFSPTVSAGNALFTLIGFMGIYVVLGILFLFLVYREIEHGPEEV
jgi:cytochrome d ubiquinol oxidase subunit I